MQAWGGGAHALCTFSSCELAHRIGTTHKHPWVGADLLEEVLDDYLLLIRDFKNKAILKHRCLDFYHKIEYSYVTLHFFLTSDLKTIFL